MATEIISNRAKCDFFNHSVTSNMRGFDLSLESHRVTSILYLLTIFSSPESLLYESKGNDYQIN